MTVGLSPGLVPGAIAVPVAGCLPADVQPQQVPTAPLPIGTPAQQQPTFQHPEFQQPIVQQFPVEQPSTEQLPVQQTPQQTPVQQVPVQQPPVQGTSVAAPPPPPPVSPPQLAQEPPPPPAIQQGTPPPPPPPIQQATPQAAQAIAQPPAPQPVQQPVQAPVQQQPVPEPLPVPVPPPPAGAPPAVPQLPDPSQAPAPMPVPASAPYAPPPGAPPTCVPGPPTQHPVQGPVQQPRPQQSGNQPGRPVPTQGTPTSSPTRLSKAQFERRLYRLTHSPELSRAAAAGDRAGARSAMRKMRREVTALARRQGMSRGELMVTIARQEANDGVRERNGSNESKRIREYRAATAEHLSTPGPWCNYFTSFVASAAGLPVGEGGKGSGYVPTTEAWARNTDRWRSDESTPRVGDSVLFDWQGDGTPDHIGIVASVGKNGIRTIEGNINDKMVQRYRNFDEVHGYVSMSGGTSGARRGGPGDDAASDELEAGGDALAGAPSEDQFADAPQSGGQFSAPLQAVQHGANLANITAPPTAAPFAQAQ